MYTYYFIPFTYEDFHNVIKSIMMGYTGSIILPHVLAADR